MKITYRIGPLGYTILKDDKVVGSCRKRASGRFWLVTLPGSYLKAFRTLTEAKAAIRERINV